MSAPLKVLVTGGAGFIGSHLVEGLVARGHQVRVLDNFFAGRLENLHGVRGDVEVHEGDCADPVAARKAVLGVEVVFHEAAVPSVARSIESPALCQRSGGMATLSMLVAARDAGVRRFVYAGSSSVYGDVPRLPKRESMEPHPISPYAVEKLVGEHYLRVFARLYGMETLTLRYFNVFGPRQDANSPYSGVISRFIGMLLRGETPAINGDGRQSRDFTYVANVVSANLLALRAAGLVGQVVNIATGRRITVNQLFAMLAQETDRNVKAEHRPARPGDVRHSLADLTEARRLLGYRPQVDVETGLRRTVAWYRRRAARPELLEETLGPVPADDPVAEEIAR